MVVSTAVISTPVITTTIVRAENPVHRL